MTTHTVRAFGAAYVLSVLAPMSISCAPAKRGAAPNANSAKARTILSASPLAPPGSTSASAAASAPPVPTVQKSLLPQRDARFDADWQWIRTRFPQAKAYRDAQHDSWLPRLLDWAPVDGAITVFDRSCRAVQVRRTDEVLHGYIHRSFTLEVDTLVESMDEILLGASLAVYDGSVDTYERNAEGIWEQASSGGGGGGTTIGFALSKVTADAAWYDDVSVTLSTECAEEVQEESVCRNGSRRTCARCEGWGLFPTSSDSSFGGAWVPARRKVMNRSPSDCGAPCPAIERPADVKRAAEILRGHAFFMATESAPHPFVFRTENACKAYRKVHRFSRDELDVWRANDPIQSVEP